MKSGTTRAYVDPRAYKHASKDRLKSHFRLKEKSIIDDDSYEARLTDKLLCFSCYFTFGLSGLFVYFSAFISGKKLNRFMMLHTFQSLFLGLTIIVSMLVLEGISLFSSFLIFAFESYRAIYQVLYVHYPLIIFCVVSVFAIAALSGREMMLPGISRIARQIIK